MSEWVAWVVTRSGTSVSGSALREGLQGCTAEPTRPRLCSAAQRAGRARARGRLEPWVAGSIVALPLPGRRVPPCGGAVAGAVGQVVPQVRAVNAHTLAIGQHTHIVPVDLFGFGLGDGLGSKYNPKPIVSVDL